MRFLHAADLHLDSPFRGLSQVSDRVAGRMRDATVRTLDRLAAEARRAQVDCVLLAGDTYDSADRSVRAQVRLRDVLGALARDGVETLAVLGNHDPADGWTLNLAMPGVHVFPPGRVGGYDVVVEGRAIGHVDGISYPTREVTDNYAARMVRQDSAPVAVALLHANVGGGASGHADYAPARMEDFLASGHDYWALGHVHTRQELRAQGPAVVYPGNPQGRSMREPGVRGAYVVEVADARVTELRFVPLCDVVFDHVEVDVSDVRGDLPDLLAQTLEDLRRAPDAAARVARLHLTGEGDGRVRDLMDHPARRRELLAFLQEEAERRLESCLVWPEGIVDDSVRPRANPAPGSLLADVAELAALAARGAAGEGEALRAEARRVLSPLVDQAALRFLGPTVDDATLARWIARAADRLLRDLGEEDAS